MDSRRSVRWFSLLAGLSLACFSPYAHAGWSYAPWTGDADCGVDSRNTYTCAVNFNGAAVTVNGVPFNAHSGNTADGNGFSLGGAFANNPSRATLITGSSKTLSDNGFIYNGNPRTVTLRGLTVGKVYRTTFFAFGWEASPTTRIQTFSSNGERVTVDQNLYGLNNGITISYTFVADAETRVLTVTPASASTMHLSALANCEVAAPLSYWSSSPWTSDATSGIDSRCTYTCAVNFNGAAVTINGVPFAAHNGSATSGTGWSIGGGMAAHGGVGASLLISGNSQTLGNPFIYNGNPRTVTVTGLTPGRRYTTTLYAFGWEAAGGRVQTFASGSDSALIDQDGFGQNQGIRISYTFVADAVSRVITVTPTVVSPLTSLHLSGLSNRETLPALNPAEFAGRLPITFGSYAGTQKLTNFPVLVKLTDGVNGFAAALARSDGADLRFTAGDGTTPLDFELEEWEPTGTSCAWVRIPAFTNNTTIYAYWGNDNLGRLPASQTDGSVWLANYKAVWHLDKVNGVEDLRDSALGRLDGTDNGNSYTSAGLIANGQRFDPSDGGDYLSVPYAASLNLNTFTVTAWVKLASEPGSYGIIGTRIPADRETFDIKVSGNSIHGDFGNGTAWINTAVDILSTDTGSNGQGGDLAVGPWYQVTYVIDDAAKQFRLFLNGDLKKTIGYAGTALFMGSGQSLWIGDDYAGHEYMNGTLDEVRIGSVARSADWIRACYLNQASNALFATYGVAQQPGIDPVADAVQKMEITFGNYAGVQTLTNFPVLVQFAQGAHGFAYARCAAGGTDLRFTAADGVTPLAYEIEEWDTLGTSYVWVRVPVLSSTTSIRAWWGSGRTLPAASQTDGSVWSQNYVGVWHLDQVNGVEDLSDATAFNNDPTADVDTANTAGRISMGQYFDGGSDYISIPDSASLSVKGNLTISAWINGSSFPAGVSQHIVAKDANAAYRCRIQNSGSEFWALLCNGVGATPYEMEQVSYTFMPGVWYNVALRADFGAGIVRFYVNGAQVGADQANAEGYLADTAGPFLIGNYTAANPNEDFIGTLDEVRVTAGLRSADWIKACWLNVASNEAFNTYGAVEANQPPQIDNASGATNVLAASAFLNGTLIGDGGGTTEVRAYYGTSNGGTTPGAWDTNVLVGVDVPVGAVTTNVTGLVSDTDYFYRCWASNSVSHAWAASSASFATRLGVAQKPSNLVAATGIERTIDLTWNENAVHATGFVVEYWKAGGPTNRVVASAAGGDTTNVRVWGLDHSTAYTFRVAATNAAIGDASPFSATASAATIPAIDAVNEADRRLRITFENFTGATLTNFPVLVVLADGSNGFAYADCHAGGTDLRFTGADGLTLINHEVENWGQGTTPSYVWVQVPALNASTVIWAYWGSAKPYYAPCQTNGAVWSEDFAGVWHLDETDGVEDLTDATAFNNDATVDANTDNVAGRIAKAQSFDGGDDYISIPDSPSLSITGNITLEAWINGSAFPDGGGTLNQNIVSKDANNAYRLRVQNGGTVFWLLLKDAGALEVESVPYTFSTGTWYHVAARVDFAVGEVRFYVNGAQIGAPQVTARTGISDSGGPLVIGNYSAGRADEDFVGTIDEVRITDGLRSADWIRASWLNVASNAAFGTYDTAQPLIPNAPRILITDGATNVLDVSAYLTATVSTTGGAATAVSVFWGTNNAADAWDEWAFTNNRGDVVQSPPVPYSTFVNGLAPATTYYYAYRATNSFGAAWLGATFKTGGRPELDNGSGAGPGVGYAALNGHLVATNRSPTRVTVFWGPSNGGTDRGAWAHTNLLGVLGNGYFATNTTLPLLYGKTYYYRCYATNGYGETWAAASASFNSLMPREANGWHATTWTGDLDSGVSNAYTYTVAVDLAGPQVTLNGVPFQSHALSGPNFAISGMGSTYPDFVNALTGDSYTLAKDFRYGGAPAAVVLTNLVAGTQYRTTFYGVGFGSVGSRVQLFGSAGDTTTVDENAYGSGQGMLVSYTFMGDATGKRAFSIAPIVLANTYHMSGLSNREVDPLVGVRNGLVSDITESTATFNGTLAGTGSVFEVYVHWGTTDGGTDTGGWDHSDYVGTFTNELAAALAYPASGLPVGMSYYTFRAVNPQVTLWAEPSTSFTCLGQPAVDNLAAVAAIGAATLKGELTGGGLADVSIFWGPTDGGDNKGLWAYTNTLGEVMLGAFATNTTLPLLYGKTYYFRSYATNAIGQDWADATATFLTRSPAQATGWTTNAWNNDATADIDSAHAYSVAVNLAGAAVTVNGVSFQAHALSGPNFTIGGLGSTLNNDANNVTGGSDILANDFRYGGNPGTVAILNLTPGRYYRTTFYGVGFGAVGERVQTFSAEGDSANIDEHQYGNNNGMRASYTFRAGAGTKNYTITPVVPANTLHLYALSNREIPMGDTLAVLNGAASGIGRDAATLSATLYATQSVFAVYAHWGTTDGGTDPGAWDETRYVGAYTNVRAQGLSCAATGLADNTHYYYTFQASNAAASVWAVASEAFTTLGGPKVSNLPATGVTLTAATLHGELTDGTSADVTLYWGLADGGTTAGAWAHTNALGSYALGPFAATVAVRAGGTYYYRAYATNAYGADWADTAATFATPQATLAIADTSVVEGHAGATNAVFNVTLSSPCASNVTVSVLAVSGTALVGSDLPATNGTFVVGAGETAAQLRVAVTGDGAMEWPWEYFDVSLSAAAGCALGDASARCTIIDDDVVMGAWRYKMKIRFAGYDKGEVLRDFPALVTFGPGLSNFGYDQFESPVAGDLRFSDGAATRMLDYDIDEWRPTTNSCVWVRVPELSDTNSYIWAYWGNESATNPPPCTTNGAAWRSDYEAVWHLGATNGVSDLADATARGLDAVGSGAPGYVPSAVANGLAFNGTEYLTAACPSAFAGNASFTFSCWINHTPTSARACLMDFGNRATGSAFHALIAASGTTQLGVWGGIQNQPDIAAYRTRWLYLTTVYRASDRIVTYLNGVEVESAVMSVLPNFNTSGGLRIGQMIPAESNYRGLLDEVRLSSAARSSNWVWACWMNQASNAVFTGYSRVEARPRPPSVFRLQ